MLDWIIRILLNRQERETPVILIPKTIINFNPISSLEVFILQTKEEQNLPTIIHGNIYWKDSVSVVGFGPFITLYDCFEHYKQIVLSRKEFTSGLFFIEGGLKLAKKDNVLSIQDFKSKKRGKFDAPK